MTETATPLTPARALDTLRSVETLTDALRRRTNGITWMIWGFAIPAIFLSYNALGATGLLNNPSAGMIVLLNLLWAPWVAMGILATRAIWRSAALQPAQDARRARQHGILQALLFVGTIFGGMAVVSALRVPLVEPGVALLGVGLASVLSGAFGLNAETPQYRRAWIGSGLFLLAVALVSAFFSPTQPDWMPYLVFGTVAPLATAIAYVGAGMWIILRA